ncbi:Aste57867_9951 [Aphanomyces stellatus]|uniref:Aste57867_9951 protein n=1 Tax=Aphanomyces stellatus TaxID=120398 RepID=A0A485KQ08_9STRA|nr:hypothetical protein As57867_009912 [Aphanomyces stellatus]VFT86829.1 Aste57867_9951 [Aphanomyces stellatus]
MNVQAAYSQWSEIYDTNTNPTRDLEGVVCRDMLAALPRFKHVLEMGCGTGKNTEWLAARSARVTAVDLTQAMLDVAAAKMISSPHVAFVQADMLQTMPWSSFVSDAVDLVTFSLVLEHAEYLVPIFKSVDAVLEAGGRVYIGEFHPFKQYHGSKARFESKETGHVEEVTAFTHHASDFVQPALALGWTLERMDERFDGDRCQVPRIIGFLFRKGQSS